ncbi:MAG: hypothetical protein ACRD19_14720 [Terriglobia bacterium]
MRRSREDMRKFHPSPSFEIVLPDQIVHQSDERVSSFWTNGEPVLLQLSSYLKRDGEPMPARQRLQERIDKSSGQWKVWEESPIMLAETQQAIAETFDESGRLWIHAYIVWPHLTIYATISGPEDRVRDPENWAMTALKGMRLNVQ